MQLPMGPWAILRSHLDNYALSDESDLMAEADVLEANAMYAAREQSNPRQGSVAVVPVLGPITKRDTFLTMLFGGTSTNRLVAQLDMLANDPATTAVVLNIDSPGGTISGLPEAAAAIRRLRDRKPVVAISNDLAASAAYWLASQASEIVGTPESLTGSVGVYLMHVDYSGMMEQDGIDVTYISSSPEKVEGNPYEPLSEGAREDLQAIVDSSYDLFTRDVAKGRGVSVAKVKSDYGKGRVLDAQKALAAGVIDRIGTYADAIAYAAQAQPGRRAEADIDVVADSPSGIDDNPPEDGDEVTFDDDILEENALLPALDRWRFNR